jgi:hypothetical protein
VLEILQHIVPMNRNDGVNDSNNRISEHAGLEHSGCPGTSTGSIAAGGFKKYLAEYCE